MDWAGDGQWPVDDMDCYCESLDSFFDEFDKGLVHKEEGLEMSEITDRHPCNVISRRWPRRRKSRRPLSIDTATRVAIGISPALLHGPI